MMTGVSIHTENEDVQAPRFRAVAGRRQSVGRTAGEALDALLAQEGDSVESSAILVQRFIPDSFFTQAQYDRMRELFDRRASLNANESDELDALIDAELDATVKRTSALGPQSKP